MFDSTKARLQRSKEFVVAHKSVVTHTVSASVGAYVSYKLATRRMDDTYELLGKMMTIAKTSLDFIEEKELMPELKAKVASELVKVP